MEIRRDLKDKAMSATSQEEGHEVWEAGSDQVK